MQDITHGLGGLRSAVALQSKLLVPTKYTRKPQPSCTGIDVSDLAVSENTGLASDSQAAPRVDTSDFDAELPGTMAEAEQQSSSMHSPAEIFEQLTSGLEVSIVSINNLYLRCPDLTLSVHCSYHLPTRLKTYSEKLPPGQRPIAGFQSTTP